jgi:uncharacterized protein
MSFNLDSLGDILVCPKSKSKLVLDGDSLISVDPECRLRYEIRDGIPVMLVDEAVEMPREDWAACMQKYGRDPQTGAPLQTPPSSA